MNRETLQQPIELIDDPWQAALDAVFEEKFSAPALARQADEAVSLRTEATNFLSIAENLVGFQAMQNYAMQMCLNHPHLEETVQGFMEERDDHSRHDHANQAKSGTAPDEKQKKSKKKKKFRGWFRLKET